MLALAKVYKLMGGVKKLFWNINRQGGGMHMHGAAALLITIAIVLLAGGGPALALAPDRPINQLIEELHSSDPEVQTRAIFSLANPELATEAAIQALLGMLNDNRSSLRLYARDALRHQGSRAAAALAAYDHARLERLEQKLSDPDYETWQGVLIVLRRSTCSQPKNAFLPSTANCPEYEVRVHGDGVMLFKGWRGVAQPGERAEPVGRELLQHLLAAFKTARFLSLNETYEAVPDGERIVTGDIVEHLKPTVTITLVLGGESITVRHYLGDTSAPPELTKLEESVDRLLATERWVK